MCLHVRAMARQGRDRAGLARCGGAQRVARVTIDALSRWTFFGILPAAVVLAGLLWVVCG